MAKLIKSKSSWILRPRNDERNIAKSFIYSAWDRKTKTWHVIPSFIAFNALKEKFKDIEIEPEIELIVNKEKEDYATLESFKTNPNIKYSFGDHKPFEHQVKAFNFARHQKSCALFLDQGLGKTFVIAHLIEDKIANNIIKKALIVCPRSVINAAWMSDINKFTNLKAISLHDKSSKKRAELFKEEADVYIINFEGVNNFMDEIKDLDIQMLVVDESSKCKSYKTKISKNLSMVARRCEYKVIASGTPAPNSPLELWPQYAILDQGRTLGVNFFKFRSEFCTQFGFGGFQWNCNKENRERIKSLISHKTIRFKKEDCLDLPPQTFIKREVQLSDEQEKHYNDMAEKMIAELAEGVISKAEIAVTQIIRFQQITSGFLKSVEGVELDFKTNPKLAELNSLVEEIGPNKNKIIIWARFKHDIRNICKDMAKYGVVDLFGETKNKDENIDQFKNNDDVRILVAHPASAAHGLTLTEANYAIYYSMDYSLEYYQQSVDRIHRIGQDKKTFYYHLISPNTIDEAIMKALVKKEDIMQKLLNLDIVKAIRGEYHA